MLATTGTIGLFTVETADTLPKGGFAFSAYGNKFGRMPGSNTILEIGLDATYGITNRLNVYGSFIPYGHTHMGNGSQLGSLAFQKQRQCAVFRGTVFPVVVLPACLARWRTIRSRLTMPADAVVSRWALSTRFFPSAMETPSACRSAMI